MKYPKTFKIRDQPKKIYMRMNIIKEHLKGKKLTEIANLENCSIRTVKKWVDRYKLFIKTKKENNIQYDRKRKISIPYKVQRYIIKKCSNKSSGRKDGISLNYFTHN